MAAITLDLTNLGQPRDMGATTRRYLAKVTGPASYATGGDTGIAASVGVGKVFAVLGAVISNGTLTYVGWWNPATDALLWFDMAGAQVANAVDLSTFTGQLEIIAQ